MRFQTEIFVFKFQILQQMTSLELNINIAHIQFHFVPRSHLTLNKGVSLGEQGWRSGDRACLPPMWPGFEVG